MPAHTSRPRTGMRGNGPRRHSGRHGKSPLVANGSRRRTRRTAPNSGTNRRGDPLRSPARPVRTAPDAGANRRGDPLRSPARPVWTAPNSGANRRGDPLRSPARPVWTAPNSGTNRRGDPLWSPARSWSSSPSVGHRGTEQARPLRARASNAAPSGLLGCPSTNTDAPNAVRLRANLHQFTRSRARPSVPAAARRRGSSPGRPCISRRDPR